MIDIRRKTRSTSEMSMSSMSDIAFLLIIFFTITSVFIASEGMELILPDKNRDPVAVSSSTVVKVSLFNDSRITVDSKKVEKSELFKHLRGIKKHTDQYVLFQIEGNAPYRDAVEIIQDIEKSKYSKLSIRMMKGHGD